jgi:hypothetical protein
MKRSWRVRLGLAALAFIAFACIVYTCWWSEFGVTRLNTASSGDKSRRTITCKFLCHLPAGEKTLQFLASSLGRPSIVNQNTLFMDWTRFEVVVDCSYSLGESKVEVHYSASTLDGDRTTGDFVIEFGSPVLALTPGRSAGGLENPVPVAMMSAANGRTVTLEFRFARQ